MSGSIVIDEEGSLAEPDLHDAFLYRIDFGGEHVTLYFRGSLGGNLKLDLRGVVLMSSSGLAEKNIVLDVTIQHGSDVHVETVNALFPGKTQAQDAYRGMMLHRLRMKELILLQISPSYGGEITIICEGVEHAPILEAD